MSARPPALLLALAAVLAAAQPAAAASPSPPAPTVLEGLAKRPALPLVTVRPRGKKQVRRARLARRAALRGLDSWTYYRLDYAGAIGSKQFYWASYWQWSSKLRTYVIWWDLWGCAGGACARTTIAYFSLYWGGRWYGPWGPYRV